MSSSPLIFIWLFSFFSCLAAVKAGPHFLLPEIFPVSYSYESPTISILSLTLEDPCQGGFHSYVVTCLSLSFSVYILSLSGSSHLLQSHNHYFQRAWETYALYPPFTLSIGVIVMIWMALEPLQGSSKDFPLYSSGLCSLTQKINFPVWFSTATCPGSQSFSSISCMSVSWLPWACSSDAHLHPTCMARCGVLRVYGMRL